MNQRGEITLLSASITFLLTLLFFLTFLELKREFSFLEKRSKLFLCAKETKEELHLYLKLMGRTNWSIENLNRVKIITLIIPGTQGVALNAERLKKMLIMLQNSSLLHYFKRLNNLKKQGCPLDPQMIKTPFKLSLNLLERNKNDAAILRSESWNYYFWLNPYLLKLKISAKDYNSPTPKITFQTAEKEAKYFSLSSFAW